MNKLNATENEKASLLTVIHLLQSENSSCAADAIKDRNIWSKKQSRNTRREDKKALPKSTSNINISTGGSNQMNLGHNQFASLTIEISADDEETHLDDLSELPTNSSSKKTARRKQTSKRHHTPKSPNLADGSIGILGDSMLKMLNPSKLRRSTGKKLVVKTFPGATTADMNC
jgi:hypothetical protein